MKTDPRDCPVSTGSAQAIAHCEQAMWRMLSYFGDPFADLDAAIAEDPGWAMPLVMKANVLLGGSEHALAQQAHALLDHAEGLAAGNPRERAHIAASRACAHDQWQDACDRWEAILVDHPRDVLALYSAHLFDFFRGDARSLQRRVARVLPAWSDDTPLYPHVLALHAFGLEETNLYDRALESAHAALALQPREPWAIHAVAHVHEMRGEYAEGERWLSSRIDDWAPDNGFAFHNWWHLGLFHLERLDFAKVLELFDERIAPGTDMALQHVDACAMLWRLQLMGVDVGDRWRHAADRWPAQAPDMGHYAFNDFHATLACLGAGRMAQAREVHAAVEARARDAAHTHLGRLAADIGVPLLRGMLDYAEGDYDSATERLLALRARQHRFGGSHAQRDVVEQTLLDAAIRAGRKPLARHLLNERLLSKADSPLTGHWQRRLS